MGVLELDDTGKITLMRDYFDSKLALEPMPLSLS